jgi:SAM-dependent methyltransferase
MLMSGFQTHFSALADTYARFRPGYPDALFDYLAALAPARELAWDCATGSGQAAAGLGGHFDEVIATDASAEQIAAARPAPHVTYRVAPAERSGLEERSVDLVTVAQALHWFDLERFYGEVRRVLIPGGVLAVWSYNFLTVDPSVDAVIDGLYRGPLDPYWPPERIHVEQGYRGLPFPFPVIETPDFAMETRWDMRQMLGYLSSWSATRRCNEATGRDVVEEIAPALARVWGNPASKRTVRWPLVFRIGHYRG